MPSSREKWSETKMAYTADQRRKIMACIHRLNSREGKAIERAVMDCGGSTLPRPHLRVELRAWFRQRWSYLIAEYEKVLPHVEELPEEQVERIVREHLGRLATT